MKRRYKVGDLEKDRTGKYICICADSKTAVFAPYQEKRDGGVRVKYRDMYARTNFPGIEGTGKKIKSI